MLPKDPDQQSLALRFREAADEFAACPLYRALCLVVADDERLLEIATHRRPGQQPANLLFAAVHFLLLDDPTDELARWYPSIDRIARLGMVPVTQPGSIAELGDIWRDHLGERVHHAMPLRDQLELGIRPAISSDAFVQSYRPLDTIAAAVHRMTPSGVRIGPDQELTIEEALTAHTINAARAIHMEDRIGSIEVGKLADFAVLDGDLLAASAEAIRKIPIWMTVVGGEVRYSAAEAASGRGTAHSA